ncbi:MAG: cobalamin biosynthesis protein [Magnetococcales bacterium]|nr:cobalamin biosynthesis protein [Magnetococcales bacterium]
MKPALIAITRRGAQHAARLANAWPDAELFILNPWGEALQTPFNPIDPPLRGHIQTLLENHSPLCFFCALGAVVRLSAPYLRSKREDPAILAIDEMARFVIPVLSGHLGGANQYAQEVAQILGALPVITTASDSIGTLAVDLLGRELGWQIEADPHSLIRTAAQVVNGLPVAIVQECGTPRWKTPFTPLANNLILLDDVAQADPSQHKALLWITHQPIPPEIAARWPESLVVYRPPKGQGRPFCVGLGCDRGTSLATIQQALEQALALYHLQVEDIQSLATIDIKGDEVGMLALADQLNRELILYPASQLATVSTPNPSETVRRYTGTPSVSEAAALLAAKTDASDLLVEKYPFKGSDQKNATISLALTPTQPSTPMER